ncbi:GNAT family N-acetyltransferase [Natranaeroarchaeum aerophilus]|uniref:GNAT family N-acetyltransferase n=1 Tax=Natranaeroarchaeum aerophilus TaxID=2917711 RepID=A0AAE3K3Z6_9EURY|nr:GNAT family N-acetyltransferase [Natranaeroarchaeum aerophilus]MCL9812848.1 GNAT family N-acetyltransferase [Natranaeroarchaeum aerophilus]
MTSVRIATGQDTEAILALHTDAIRVLGADAYNNRQIDAWAEKEDGTKAYPTTENGHHLVVAERDGKIAGYGHVITNAEEIRAVYVDPDHARCGVGSTILAHLEGYALGQGLDRVELWSSLNAVPFYERQGYRTIRDETIQKEYEGESVPLPVRVMEKTFGPWR